MHVVVEGTSDEQAAEAVIRAAGREVTRVHVTNGSARLDSRLLNYRRAAARSPWVVFRDTDARCPVELRAELVSHLPHDNPRFALRLAHSMTEAWLLADPKNLAAFLGVRVGRVPANPEALPHAKYALLELCLKSRSRALRHDMVRSATEIGPLYPLRVNEFASNHWDVAAASEHAPSLRRAIAAIRAMPEELK